MEVRYWVVYGDYDVGEYKDIVWESWKEGDDLPDPPKLNTIDDRTIKSIPFDTVEEAEAKTIKVIEDDDDGWLAFVKIEKTITTVVKEYDIEKLRVLK
jgi:hypothetical protein